jgi:hypothetical protein
MGGGRATHSGAGREIAGSNGLDEARDFHEERGSGSWDLLAEVELKRTGGRHRLVEGAHQGPSLEMVVPEQHIRSPATH